MERLTSSMVRTVCRAKLLETVYKYSRKEDRYSKVYYGRVRKDAVL